VRKLALGSHGKTHPVVSAINRPPNSSQIGNWSQFTKCAVLCHEMCYGADSIKYSFFGKCAHESIEPQNVRPVCKYIHNKHSVFDPQGAVLMVPELIQEIAQPLYKQS
jgi:hypothetical protein